MDLAKLMARGKKIYHRNDIRQELSALSLPPRRILWLILAQLDKDEGGDIVYVKDRVFTIRAKEYAQLCQIDESVAYKQLKSGVEEIRTRLMRMPESELLSPDELERRKRPKDGVVLFTVANYSYYTDGEGYVEVKLDPIIAPFISKLRKNFTGQFLLSALRLPDSNANKLYLLVREWISSGLSVYKDIDIDELKNKLGVDTVKTYAEFKHFKRLFFNRAVNRIIESTEFTKIEIEIIERRSRKAKKVRISYEYDGQKRDMGDAGFYLGKDKKQKVKEEHIDEKEKKLSKNDNEPYNYDGLKQINGRYYTKEEAKAAGLKWDDY